MANKPENPENMNENQDTEQEKQPDFNSVIAALEKKIAALEKKASKAEASAPAAPAPDYEPGGENDPNRRVKIKLFKDGDKYSEPLYVAVNGYNAQIQRGVTVEVPYYVAKHLEECQKQDEHTAMLISQLESEFEQRKNAIT